MKRIPEILIPAGVGLAIVVAGCTTTDGRQGPHVGYLASSRFTDPGERATMLDALPDDPLAIAAVAENLTVHHNLLPHLGVPREQWSELRGVWPPRTAAALAALGETGPGDILTTRAPTERLRGACMSESHLLAAMLRYRRIPVRIRAGYFRDVYTNEARLLAFWEQNARAKGVAQQLLDEDPERWREVNHDHTRQQVVANKCVEHWVAEYWDEGEAEWRRLDANTAFLKAMSDIEVGYHLPRRHFEYAHEAWRKMRTAADFDPDQYAEWPQDGRSHIRAQLLWDFCSLLNHDIAGYDKSAWPAAQDATTPERQTYAFIKETKYEDVPQAELAELDALAELLAANPGLDDLVAFYRGSEHLRIATLEADPYSFAHTTPTTTDFTLVHGGPQFDRGVYVSPTRDGGCVAVGVTKSLGAGEGDVYLLRTDAHGELQWSRAIGGAGDDNGWSVHETADGFVLAGFTSSFGAGDYDFYLVKTDPNGEPVWSRTYGGEGKDRCWALLVTADGGYLLVGETTSTGAGEEDVHLVKTDAQGDELWSRTYGGSASDRCFAVAPAEDGGYVLAGQTYSEGAGDRDAYILKTDADGVKEWSRTFGGPASDVAHSVVRTATGDFLVTGYTTSFATNGDDPYLIRIDAHGETRWTRVLAMEGTVHTLTGDQAADGGFYLVGFAVYPATGTRAALLVKTDADGRLAWRRDILPTTMGESFGYTVRATADGGCVLTGHTTVNSAGDRDLLLVGVSVRDRRDPVD